MTLWCLQSLSHPQFVRRAIARGNEVPFDRSNLESIHLIVPRIDRFDALSRPILQRNDQGPEGGILPDGFEIPIVHQNDKQPSHCFAQLKDATTMWGACAAKSTVQGFHEPVGEFVLAWWLGLSADAVRGQE